MPSNDNTAAAGLRYIIIGAGMSGMLTAIKLLDRGETNFTIYEKGDSVGGTWRENTYPGLACDTPAHSYTYSFAYNPEWNAYYATGNEIRGYFEGIADKYDLRKYTQFNTEITSAKWDGTHWNVTTKDGRADRGQILVCATGVLHVPVVADIPGLKDFKGPCFHSARWDHSSHDRSPRKRTFRHRSLSGLRSSPQSSLPAPRRSPSLCAESLCSPFLCAQSPRTMRMAFSLLSDSSVTTVIFSSLSRRFRRMAFSSCRRRVLLASRSACADRSASCASNCKEKTSNGRLNPKTAS